MSDYSGLRISPLSFKLLVIIFLLSTSCTSNNLKSSQVYFIANTITPSAIKLPSLTSIYTPAPSTPTSTYTLAPTKTSTPTPTNTLYPSVPISSKNVAQLTEVFKLPNGVPPSITWIENGKEVAVGFDTKVFIFDVQTSQMVRSFNIVAGYHAEQGVFSPDGSLLAMGGHIWDVYTGELSKISYEGFSPVFSSDGKALGSFVSSNPETRYAPSDFKVIDLNNGNSLSTIENLDQVIYQPALLQGKKLLATGGINPGIWDLDANKLIKPISAGIHWVQRLMFSYDGEYLAGGTDDGIVIWNVEEGHIHKSFSYINMSRPITMDFSPDSKLLAFGGQDGDVWISNVSDGTSRIFYEGHRGYVTSVSFSPDGRFVASIGIDQIVNIIEIPTGTITSKFPVNYYQIGHLLDVNDIFFSTDGKIFATKSYDQTINIWKVGTFNKVDSFNITGLDGSLVISPNSKYLTTALFNNGLQIINLNDRSVFEQLLKGKRIDYFVYSPNGNYLAVGNGLIVNIFETTNWVSIKKLDFTFNNAPLSGIAFSPDGKTIAVSTSSIYLFDTTNWSKVIELKAKRTTGNLAFSPNGRYLASGSADNSWTKFSTIIYDMWNWQIIKEIKSTSGNPINQISFSPNGELVAIYDGWWNINRYLTIYNVDWEEIFRVNNAFYPIAFSPDGLYLVVKDGWETIVFLGIP